MTTLNPFLYYLVVNTISLKYLCCLYEYDRFAGS